MTAVLKLILKKLSRWLKLFRLKFFEVLARIILKDISERFYILFWNLSNPGSLPISG